MWAKQVFNRWYLIFRFIRSAYTITRRKKISHLRARQAILWMWADLALQEPGENRSCDLRMELEIFLVFLCFTAALISNGLVLGITFQSKRLRRLCYYNITSSLAVCHLLLMLVFGLHTTKGWLLGMDWCRILAALGYALGAITILHLCAIAIERYSVILKPFHYKEEVNYRTFFVSMLVLWVLPIVLALSPILADTSLYVHNPDTLRCEFNWTEKTTLNQVYVAFLVFMYFLVPIIIIGFTYGKMFSIAKSHFRQINSLKPTTASNEGSMENAASQEPTMPQPQKQERQQQNQEKQQGNELQQRGGVKPRRESEPWHRDCIGRQTRLEPITSHREEEEHEREDKEGGEQEEEEQEEQDNQEQGEQEEREERGLEEQDQEEKQKQDQLQQQWLQHKQQREKQKQQQLGKRTSEEEKTTQNKQQKRRGKRETLRQGPHREAARENRPRPDGANRSAGSGDNDTARRPPPRHSQARSPKAVKTIGAIIIIYCFCYVPYSLVRIFKMFFPQDVSDSVVSLSLLAALSSLTLNPVVYCFGKRDFRVELLKRFGYLRRLRGRGVVHPSHPRVNSSPQWYHYSVTAGALRLLRSTTPQERERTMKWSRILVPRLFSWKRAWGRGWWSRRTFVTYRWWKRSYTKWQCRQFQNEFTRESW